jgi:diaminopimelate decarboxylase
MKKIIMGIQTFFCSFFQQNAGQPEISEFFPDIMLHKVKINSILSHKTTPLFIIDKTILENRYAGLSKELSDSWQKFVIAYSFKTNYEVAGSQVFQKLGSWAEVVSGYEYKLAKKYGYKGKNIIFNGPLKADNDLLMAHADKALIHIDNLSELKRVIELAQSTPILWEIGIRINTDNSVYPSRFGFSLDRHEAHNAIDIISANRNIRLVSIHNHLGSDIDNSAIYVESVKKITGFIKNIDNKKNIKIKYLDFGGGYPAHGKKPYGKDSWNPKPIHDYIFTITKLIKRSLPTDLSPTLIFEPGRYLVDDGVFLISRVYDIRVYDDVQHILADAAITMLPLSYYRPQIIKVFSAQLIGKIKDVRESVVLGSTCKEDDQLYNGKLPKVDIGDYIIFYCVGAYNQSMGSEFIFGKPNIQFL